MIIPTIHLNGTGQQQLLDANIAAITALSEALAKAQEAGPNQRDYYPQGDAAFTAAVEEHRARLALIEKAIEEFEALALAISDGGQR